MNRLTYSCRRAKIYCSPVGEVYVVLAISGGQQVQKSMASVPDSELSIPRNPTSSKNLLFTGACQILNDHMTTLSLSLPKTPTINNLHKKNKIGPVWEPHHLKRTKLSRIGLYSRTWRNSTDFLFSEYRSTTQHNSKYKCRRFPMRPSHTTTETAKKVVVVHTHYNFFSQLKRFFQQYYIWTTIFTKIFSEKFLWKSL